MDNNPKRDISSELLERLARQQATYAAMTEASQRNSQNNSRVAAIYDLTKPNYIPEGVSFKVVEMLAREKRLKEQAMAITAPRPVNTAEDNAVIAKMFGTGRAAGYNPEVAALLQKPMSDRPAKAPAASPAYYPEPTEEANTKYGVERVNANTANTGVTATRDANGRVTLTNIGVDGKPTERSQHPPSWNPLEATTAANVNSLLTQLQSSSSVDEAQGIASSLRTALAEESTALKDAAIKQAEIELGVGLLKQQLAMSEQNDRYRPGYAPGVGDSPQTLALRKQLTSRQGEIENKAQTWLTRNISYARLGAASKNAEEAITRIVTKGAVTERRLIEKERSAELRKEAQRDKALISYEGLSPAQRQLLVRLNPSLASEGKEEEAVSYITQQSKMDKDFVSIMQADPTEYKDLAFSGNKHAAQLLAVEEAARTGRTTQDIEAQIKQAAAEVVSPAQVTEWIEQKATSVVGDKVQFRKSEQAKWNATLGDKSPEGRAALASMQAEIRRMAYRKQQTGEFLGNTLSWVAPGTAMHEAAVTTSATTGKPSLESVIKTMIAGKDTATSFELLKEAKAQVMAEGSKRQQSLLGGVNTLQALAVIDEAVKSQTSLIDRWKQLHQANTNRLLSAEEVIKKPYDSLTRIF